NSDNHSYWDIKLDQDLFQTIINIYPEWFADCNFNIMTDENGQTYIPLLESQHPLESSPKAEVDEASIRKAMDKNKESLKVKLMLRRPISQLVEQGIIPPLKTSPGFYEQSKKLERARMGDFLKHKIQRRPDRQSLIEQHILEDTTVSPSLHDKQRQLKKARLADDLNDRLSHRPGPLELVKGNILLTDERFAQAVKEGQIQFKATSEGEAIKHPPPRFVLDESSSDDAGSPPQEQLLSEKEFNTNDCSSITVLSHESPTNASILLSPSPASLISSPPSVPQQNFSATRNITAVTFSSPSVTSASPSFSPSSCGPQTPKLASKQVSTSCSSSSESALITTTKDNSNLGPPNAQKKQSSQSESSETSYELLLKQQQLFLQWQLEWQQKYPQIILPAAQKTNSDQGQGSNSQCLTAAQPLSNLSQTPLILTQNRSHIFSTVESGNNSNSSSNGNANNSSFNVTVMPKQQNSLQISSKVSSKLEDMKVSDLKIELKKRNLPVSGSKPQLIERLKPFYDELSNNQQKSISVILSNGVVVKSNISSSKQEELLPDSPSNKPESKIDNSQSDSSLSSKESAQNSPLPMEVDPSMFVSTNNDASNVQPVNNDTNGCEKEANFNDEVFRLQQKKIEELQKELQRSQFQLHIQSPPVFSNPSQSVTIPLTAIATPQIQFANLAAFIHNQASQQQQQQQQLQQHHQQLQHSQPATVTPLPAFLTTQLLDSKSFPSFQHVLLYPGSITTTNQTHFQTNNTPVYIKQERTNSLPNVIQHKTVSQRTTSLPNFATLVQKSDAGEKQESAAESKPPPDYDEATKLSSSKTKSKNKKKCFKSQAVDDVLEILIKNGELPPSAAQEPATPTTPEKISNKNKPSVSASIPPPVPPQLPSLYPTSTSTTETITESSCKPKEEETQLKLSEENSDFNLDFDFSMELQELADSMDFSSLNNVQNNQRMQNCNVEQNNNLTKSADLNLVNSSNNLPTELSLNDFIDFQDSTMNVDDSDWLQDIVISSQTNEDNAKTKNSESSLTKVESMNIKNCEMPMADKHNSSFNVMNQINVDHDPILPNNLVENSQSDPLIDLLFDENDYKPNSDLGTLVWDRSDYTA
ncbi:MKL/myocardin-like protein 1, partial [Dinothrombium tinctorium]